METPPILNKPKTTPRQRKKRGKLIVGILLFLGLLAWVMFVSAKKKDPAIAVQTEKVARHSITETVVANGKVYPVRQVHISAEVSGEITEMNVKEGQFVHKGDQLLKIKPTFYEAQLNQAKASYLSSISSRLTSLANLERAVADFKRNKELFEQKLLPDSEYVTFKVAHDIALAQVSSASNQVAVAKAAVDSAQEALDKTTIVAPMEGTITKLNVLAGERVLGTVQNAGTDIMVISDLSAIEARVDIGETDIINLQPGQKAKLEVDAFKDKKFAGVVTDVANSSQGLDVRGALGGGGGGGGSQQSATLFQVKILFKELENFRPGMSVTATIETRTRTNAIAAPIAAVTARNLSGKMTKSTNAVAGDTNAPANLTGTNSPATNSAASDKKENRNKPVECVFVVDGDKVKAVPVKLGVSDENFYEITEGLKEGDEIVTGDLNAISRTLEDGKKISQGGGKKPDEAMPK